MERRRTITDCTDCTDCNRVSVATADEKNPRKKNRPGRAKRRRLQKVEEIHRQEADLRSAIHASSRTLTVNETVLPVDRNRILPAVISLREKFGWSKSDEQVLLKQLGFVPGNTVSIAARADRVGGIAQVASMNIHHQVATSLEKNDPIVVRLYPLAIREENEGSKCNGKKHKSRKRVRTRDESVTLANCADSDSKQATPSSLLLEPFPTMLWLTHPLLRVMISKLEVKGLGVELERRLAENPEDRASMATAHSLYGKQRWSLIQDDDQHLVKCRKWESALDDSKGVAGIRNFQAVKCLHAHAAHYLAGCEENLIGKWTMEALLEEGTRPNEERV